MRKAEPIAGLGGAALLVAALLHWGEDMGALQAVVLIVFALLFLAVPIVTLATSGPAKSIAAAVVASAFGWIAILLVLFRIVDLPGDQLEVRYGAWLALAGTVIAWVGSWLSLRDESTPGATAPDVPLRATPDAA